MQKNVVNVIERRMQPNEMIFDPEGGMDQRIILRRRRGMNPDGQQTGQRAEKRIAGDILRIVPDESGGADDRDVNAQHQGDDRAGGQAGVAGIGHCYRLISHEPSSASRGGRRQTQVAATHSHQVIHCGLLRKSNPHRIVPVQRMAQLTIQQTFDLALQHHQAGRLRQAEQIYRQVLARHPKHVDAMQNLAVVSLQLGRNDLALDLIRRTIVLNPNNPEAHYNLGKALTDMGQLHEGVVSLRQAIRIKPDYAEAHSNLGIALRGLGRFDEAIAAYREAIRLKPGYAEAHNNLGNVLRDVKGNWTRRLRPVGRPSCSSRITPKRTTISAMRLTDIGQLDEAIAAYRQAIRLKPDYAEAHSNLGNALKGHWATRRGHRFLSAGHSPSSPITPKPTSILLLTLLTRGDFQRGWEEYEWRWKCKDFSVPARNFAQPQWDG